MANYWEQPGHQPSRTAPVTPEHLSAIDLVAALRKAGKIPSPDQIEAAMAEFETTSPQKFNSADMFSGQTAQSNELNRNDLIQNGIRKYPDDPGWTSSLAMGPTSAPAPNTDFLSQLQKGSTSAIGDMWNGVTGIAQSALSQFEDQPSTPEEIMAMLRKQYGQYEYAGPSAETMVGREFDPQFQALDSAENATEGRYANNSKQMQGLYGAYANDVLKGRGENQQAYSQATKDINSTYAGAENNVTNNMNSATTEMGKQLALLNQNEAAPAVMQKKQEVLGEQLGQLASAQGGAAALNTQLGANAYVADTARHGIAQQAGLNAQADLSSQLEQLMQQYSQQRLGLTGQRGQALNKYGMDIDSLIQQGNQGINEAVTKAYGDTLGSQDKALDREIQQARLGLDTKELGLKYDSPNSQGAQEKLNPYDALLQRSQQVNADPQEASNDAELLFQTQMNNGGNQTIQTLMSYLEDANPGWLMQPGNKELAYDYFTRVIAGQQK